MSEYNDLFPPFCEKQRENPDRLARLVGPGGIRRNAIAETARAIAEEIARLPEREQPAAMWVVETQLAKELLDLRSFLECLNQASRSSSCRTN